MDTSKNDKVARFKYPVDTKVKVYIIVLKYLYCKSQNKIV